MISFYGTILQPWLCNVMYIWALALQGAYRIDDERFLDILTDATLILWTLVLWAAVPAAGFASTGWLWTRATVSRFNAFVNRLICMVVSGFMLNRWIDSWWPDEVRTNTIYWLLLFLFAGLYLLVRRRRQGAVVETAAYTPSWHDCFWFAALPVLVMTVISVGTKVSLVAATRITAPTVSNDVNFNPRSSAVPTVNVILVVADSLRAQSLSFYGRDGANTPFLDQFAKMSSVYEDMHVNATSTVPSIFTLLTGRDPIAHGVMNRDSPLNPDQRNLLLPLRQAGYTTAAVTSNEYASLTTLGLADFLSAPEVPAFMFLPFSWLRPWGIYPTGFGGRVYRTLAAIVPFLGFPEPTSYNGNVVNTLAQARNLIRRLQQPFFLFIHIHEPHDPHQVPASLLPAAQAELASHSASTVKRLAYSHYDPKYQPVVDAYRVQYEKEVQRLDDELGKFWRFLREQSMAEESLLIVTADHGESFERGYMYHGEELYENSTRVPLLIRFPNQTSGQRIEGLVQSTDIAPTILSRVNIAIPPWMEGQPLAPGVAPAEAATVAINYKHPDDDGTTHPLPSKLAIWWKRYKMIIGCNDGPLELYDLANDPEEQINLASREPELVRQLKLKLKQQLANQTGPTKLACAKIG